MSLFSALLEGVVEFSRYKTNKAAIDAMYRLGYRHGSLQETELTNVAIMNQASQEGLSDELMSTGVTAYRGGWNDGNDGEPSKLDC